MNNQSKASSQHIETYHRLEANVSAAIEEKCRGFVRLDAQSLSAEVKRTIDLLMKTDKALSKNTEHPLYDTLSERFGSLVEFEFRLTELQPALQIGDASDAVEITAYISATRGICSALLLYLENTTIGSEYVP